MSKKYPAKFWTTPIGYDVFEPDGRYLGPVTIPDNVPQFPPPVFRGDTVWAVSQDENDVPYVTRFLLIIPSAE